MSSPPFKVKAVFEYTSPHEDDLHFPNGQIITVVEEEDDDWYVGEYVDASGVKQEGLFPKNFVEKYEPTAPPRPTKRNAKKEPEPVHELPGEAVTAPPPPEPEPEPELEPEPEHEPDLESEELQTPVVRQPPPSIPKPQAVSSPPPASRAAETSTPPAPKPAPSASKPSAPPPVSEKPSSFRDRIAAFNKAAPPVAPPKPGNLGSGGSNTFIKKPFVAPPPSKNYYVPVAREPPPQKIYKREEDPEIAEQKAEQQEQAERAGLVPTSNEGDEEDQPKPTTLKERIALLQKQQAEQAARHAGHGGEVHKEKPKRPAKKRTESHEVAEEGEGAALERIATGETAGKKSMDSVREEHTGPRKRKSSRGAATTPGLHLRRSFTDGNDADMSGAGDTTEEPEEVSTGIDSDEKPRTRAPPTREPDVGEEDGATDEGTPEADEEEEDEEEEDDIDPEVRRKEELRARMAKMSGGMGMHGMFGPPGGMPMPGPAPPKKKKSTATEKRPVEEEMTSPRAPPVPMIPLPGLSRVRSPEEINRQLGHDDDAVTPISTRRPADEVPDVEDVISPHDRSAPPPLPSHNGGAPPIPGGRPAPPPVPKESRPVAAPVMSPGAGYESDDDLSATMETPVAEAPRAPPRPSEVPGSPKSPLTKRASYFGSGEPSPSSPVTPGVNKRASRLPPPIPGAPSAAPPAQSRAPPPPPPAAAPITRSYTGDQRSIPSPKQQEEEEEESEEEITEYEGDYDTDIASAAPHKDALKSHARDPSLDDSPSSAPPPLPPTVAPKAVPPPLPSQPPHPPRQSADMLRPAPPPPPPSKMPAPWEQEDDDEYDPYRYTGPPKQAAPPVSSPPPRVERKEDDIYSASPPRTFTSPPQDKPAPPPPHRESTLPPGNWGASTQSSEGQRSSSNAKRSVELGRMSMESGFVASDVDLAPTSFWWTQPKGTPPILRGRKDVLYEFEESTSTKRGGKTWVTKDLYVLFQDYSQTVITAQFDAQNPSDFKLEQRHEQPPARLRQDQLEQAHEQFGRRISEAVTAKKETVVGDGTPQGLIQELLKPFADALLPVGTRAYGAVVYGNLANASTQQNDEIRPGDIITLRNTKFQGKHGPMHQKYSMEVGKPDHVGIVAEWDGTKKKVRAWEQGRESKKVKLESFKLDDLRSGEVKIWRVMPRSWVGWQGQN